MSCFRNGSGKSNKSFPVQDLLDKFNDQVFKIQYTKPCANAKKARQLKSAEIPDWLIQGRIEMLKADPTKLNVGLISGKLIDQSADWDSCRQRARTVLSLHALPSLGRSVST